MNIDWNSILPELVLLSVAAVVAAILFVVARLVWKLLYRLSKPFPFIRDVLNCTRTPLQYLVPLIGLQTVWANAADDIFMISALRHLNTLAMIGVFTWLGLRVAGSIQTIIARQHPMNTADNLSARRVQTQTRVLVQTLSVFVILFGLSAMLMTFPGARQFGTSLLASAGLAGLAVGFAAKPVLGNIIAGLQIALTQPIRLDDVVIVEGEWGRVEEITGTYVVVRIWDERRLIVPLQWFIENPFQNWTRRTSNILGSIFFWVDYQVPADALRKELDRLLEEAPPSLWDGRVKVLQVTDATDRCLQIRILASSGDSSKSFDLRCYLRENMVAFLGRNYPDALPKLRTEFSSEAEAKDFDATPEIHTTERQPPV